MAHQNPFGGAPRIGNSASGEPDDAPKSSPAPGFGSAPTFAGTIPDRGSTGLNPDGSQTATPTPFGGAPGFVNKPNDRRVSGSGDGTGKGAISAGANDAGED